MFLHVHGGVPRGQKRVLNSGARITGSCAPLGMGVRNEFWSSAREAISTIAF